MARKRRRNRIPQEAVELSIESLNHDGRGVAHLDGKTLFVSGALPGELVTAKYLKVQRRYDEALVVDVLKPSAKRISPKCEVFGICGGCSLQHLSDADQIAFKQDSLIDMLKRLGHVEPKAVLPALTNEVPWGYRRKARLGVKYVQKKEKVLVGFREKGTSFITDTRVCHVLHPHVGQLLEPLALLIAGFSIKDKVPQIEVAIDDSQCILNFRILDAFSEEDLLALKAFAEEHKLVIYLQTGGPDTVEPLQTQAQLNYSLPEFAVDFDFEATDFTQVNTDINRKMVSLALKLLDPQAGDKILDLFCGLGNFTLPLARHCKEVVGVEGDADLVDRARINARRNGIDNTRYYLANLYETIDHEAWNHETFDRILLDPPRSGAFEIVQMIEKFKAKKIVYVSCYPGTLARDLDVLVNQKGYTLEAAGVMDMFPHTGHVESIAVLSKK